MVVEKQIYLSITKGEELGKTVHYLRNLTGCPRVVSLGWDLLVPRWCPDLSPVLTPPRCFISSLHTVSCYLPPGPQAAWCWSSASGALSPDPLPLRNLSVCHVESGSSILDLVPSLGHCAPPWSGPSVLMAILLLPSMLCPFSSTWRPRLLLRRVPWIFAWPMGDHSSGG